MVLDKRVSLFLARCSKTDKSSLYLAIKFSHRKLIKFNVTHFLLQFWSRLCTNQLVKHRILHNILSTLRPHHFRAPLLVQLRQSAAFWCVNILIRRQLRGRISRGTGQLLPEQTAQHFIYILGATLHHTITTGGTMWLTERLHPSRRRHTQESVGTQFATQPVDRTH